MQLCGKIQEFKWDNKILLFKSSRPNYRPNNSLVSWLSMIFTNNIRLKDSLPVQTGCYHVLHVISALWQTILESKISLVTFILMAPTFIFLVNLARVDVFYGVNFPIFNRPKTGVFLVVGQNGLKLPLKLTRDKSFGRTFVPANVIVNAVDWRIWISIRGPKGF